MIEIQDKYIDGLMTPYLFFWTRTERGHEGEGARRSVAAAVRRSSRLDDREAGKGKGRSRAGVSRERRRRAASLLPSESLAR